MARVRRGALVTLICAAALLAQAGCWPLLGDGASAYQRSVYESDEKIAEAEDTYVYGNRSGSEDADGGLTVTFGSFTGKETVWRLEAEEGATVRLVAQAWAEEGDFKVVLVGPAGTVTTLAEGIDGFDGTMALEEGTSRLVLVGRSARGSCSVALADAQGVEPERVDGTAEVLDEVCQELKEDFSEGW